LIPINILEKAEPAIYPISPNAPKTMLIAFGTGLLFGIPGGMLLIRGLRPSEG
jgi:capsular polysaccharide biosynthesis protein